MQSQMLWFALAGFVLGFTTSTLWEWLYYRRQRLTLREPLRYPPSMLPSAPEISAFEEEPLDVPSVLDEVTTEYRSPGVFLESEQQPGLRYPPPAEPITTLAPEARLAAWEEDPEYQTQPLTTAATLFTDRRSVATPPLVVYDDAEDEEPAYPAEGLTVAALTGPAVMTPESATQTSTFVPAESTSLAARAEPATLALPSPVSTAPPVLVVSHQEPDASASATPALIKPLIPVIVEPPVTALAAGQLRRPVEHPDDLGKIRGIGEVYKQRLFAAGIYTWQQVVDSEAEVLRRITRAKPNADIGDWQAQAQALVKQFNRGGATYSGPAPEDLALIDGIGPAAMEALYNAGITTFAQLAATTPMELAAILPAPTIGMEFHFADWIAQAAQRAQRLTS